MKKLSCANCVFDDPGILGLASKGACHYQGRNKKKYKQGEIIFSQGEKSDGIYCVSEGRVRIVRYKEHDNEFVLWYAERGEVIGVDAVLNRVNHYTTAIAAEDCVVCYLTTNDFRTLLENSTRASLDFIRILCSKIDYVESRIVNIASKSISSRLAEQIMLLIVKDRQVGKGKVRKVDFNASEVAGLLGTSRNYLYKVMAKLVKRGIVRTKMNTVEVLDFDSLVAEATGEQIKNAS
jgi:CRP/FNR family transcriptional regulator, polysaccharide utilization system transcription regulator